MHRRALPALLRPLPSAAACVVALVGCGGAPHAHVSGGGPSAASGARSETATATTTTVAPPPPAVPQPNVEVSEVTVRAGPILVSYAPEPDVAGVVVPRVSREEQRLWALHEAARRRAASAAFDDAAARAVRSTRAELVRALERGTAARPVTPASIASRVLRGYVEENDDVHASSAGPSAGPDAAPATDAKPERAASIERAAAWYREAKESAELDSPIGVVARLLLAGLEPPADAAAEYDALLGVPLSSPAMRDAVRALAGRPLGDWSRAAGVFRAVALTAATPAEQRTTRTEWLVATWNAGSFREAVDLSMVLLRQRGYPPVALDVAARGIARLGDTRVAAALPASSYATLMHHVAAMALEDRDPVLATEAARAVLTRARATVLPEAPAASAVLAACMALRGDRAGAEALLATARDAYVPGGAWGDALRKSRAGAEGYPGDAAIDALAATLSAPLPAVEASADAAPDERRAAVEIRVRALANRCFSAAPFAARTGASEARVALEVDTYDAQPPVARARLVAPLDGGESAAAIEAVLAPGLACVAQIGPRMFDGAPAGVRATVRIVPATSAAP